jgi:hypothetical protein
MSLVVGFARTSSFIGAWLALGYEQDSDREQAQSRNHQSAPADYVIACEDAAMPNLPAPLRVGGPTVGMVAFAEDFRHLISGQLAVIAAIFSVETTLLDLAAALRVCALCLGHITSDLRVTQIAVRSGVSIGASGAC